MSTAVLTEIETVADLLRELGVDASRVRIHPACGNATEKDVIAVYTREKRLCELVNGVLPTHTEEDAMPSTTAGRVAGLL